MTEKESESDLLNELNETDSIYYYDPKSIVNYSSINFTNRKNKKHQSLSVSKNSNIITSRFNQTFNNTEKKNLFQSNLNLTQHIKLQSQ